MPGGRLGRYRSLVVGAPTFEAGQRVVVFLGATPPSLPYVLGMSQGVFRVAAGYGRGSGHAAGGDAGVGRRREE